MASASSTQNMWQVLTRTVNESMEKIHLMDKILMTIKTNLTFDDPGLFSTPLSGSNEEKLCEETADLWLLNQLIYCLNISSNKRTLQYNIALQKEILSASFLKKPQFFKKTIEEYVKLIKKLIAIDSSNLGNSIELEAFSGNREIMLKIDSDAIFRKITINKIEQREHLLEQILGILIHGVNIGYDLYEDSFKECTEVFLITCNLESFNIKKLTIEYVTKLLTQIIEITPEMVKIIEVTSQAIRSIFEKLPLWMELEVILPSQTVEFNKKLLKFLKILTTFKYPDEFFSQQMKTLEIWTETLSTVYCKKNEKLFLIFDSLDTILIKFIIIWLKQWRNNGGYATAYCIDLNKIVDSIQYAPEIIRIFEVAILDEIIKENVTENLCKLSRTWQSLYVILLNSFDYINNPNIQLNVAGTQKLKIISEIFKCCNNVKHNYHVWHQSEHLQQEDCKICSYGGGKNSKMFLAESFIEIISLEFMEDNDIVMEHIKTFANKTLKCIKLGVQEFCYVVEIAAGLLQNKICFTLNTDLQIALIDFVSQMLKRTFQVPLKMIPFQIEGSIPEFENHFEKKCFSFIMNIEVEYLSLTARDHLIALLNSLLENRNIHDFIGDCLFNLMINKILPFSTIRQKIITPALMMPTPSQFLCENIKNLVCCLNGNVFIFKIREELTYKYKVICKDCDRLKECICCDKNSEKEFHLNLLKENRGVFIAVRKSSMPEFMKECALIFNSLNQENLNELIKAIPSLLSHLNLLEDEQIQTKWLQLFSHESPVIRLSFSKQLQAIIRLILSKPPEIRDPILEKCIRSLLNSVRDCLNESNKELQSLTVNMILKVGTVDGIPENTLLHLFKMNFMFFIRYESCVSHEASLCAEHICSAQGVTPRKMLNWYKQDILKLVAALCVSIFLRNGIGLNKSLNNITKMFGFLGPRDFFSWHYKLFVAVLIPWCIKHSKCIELLQEAADIVQKDMGTILTNSFLTAYLYLFVNETPEMNQKCTNFIVDRTASSLYNLLHSDIKRTVAEILIYYHKNPESVMKTFRQLLPKDVVGTQGSGEIPHGKLAEYISKRFLGVLTHFEACIIDPDFEKSLKMETLLSLGEIMRFIGSKHITPFRFKILAMLRTALTVNDVNLKRVCAQIWNIFIHAVDIQSLGPLLSTIVASLEPLLDGNAEQVNSIYKFLIMINGNLLSRNIPDLYFIENFSVDDEIKIFVAQQTVMLWKEDNFMEKFEFFISQIKHENLAVRTYGLRYLTKLFEKNRQNLNKLVLGQNNMNPNLEIALDALMTSCRNIDKNLQLAAGKCLGEIGAIEPSHLPPNYAPQRAFAMSIHTDAFAIMALEQLCRAYQFQKDTKFVDTFSLAIQEILLERGVRPKERKKMEVWEAIPERMRQLMEPLLTSCYTGLEINSNFKGHPVFGSAKGQTYDEWASNWASKMIDSVQDEESCHLLKSFKPSIKRDSNMLAVFLPYIVLHALQSCDQENVEKIYEEFQCVFEAALNKEKNQMVDFNTSRKRGLKTLQFVPSDQTEKLEEDHESIGIKCAKSGFEQLDFLERWLKEWHLVYLGHTPNSHYLRIEAFLKRFDAKLMAKANFNCGEYARALRYIEMYIETDKSTRLQENLSFLAEIYAELMNPDSLEGAIGLKKIDLTLSDQILLNNMTDRLQESTACFEKLIQSEEFSVNNIKDVVQCYLRLDTPETALLVSDGLLKRLGEKYMDDCLKETQAEPLWRLGRFDELEKLLECPGVKESSNWGVQCGQALLSFRQNDANFDQQIDNIRLNILKLLRTGGNEQNSYHKSYSQVIKLHLVSEIEKSKFLVTQLLNDTISEKEPEIVLNKFFKDWHSRLDLLQPIPRIREPVLCLRRILLSETKELLKSSNLNKSLIQNLEKLLNDEIGNMWIQSSEIMRKAGWYQQAQLCIMNAEEYQPENLFLEKAKLLWKKGDQTLCFKIIEQKIHEIEEIAGDDSESLISLPKSTLALYTEAKFLQASYNAESMNISSDLNICLFKASLIGNQKSEKYFVHLAQYMDRIYASQSDGEQQSQNGSQMLLDIMVYYGKSMLYGCEFIYQSMPRMLSIWFDFTAQMKNNDHYRRVVEKMNAIVNNFAETLPLFIFFTAFSQIVSRICHPSLKVYKIFKNIVIRLILKFPQQSLWMLLSVYKSSYTNRRKRCMEIFQDQRLSKLEMQTLISDFNALAERLIQLTNAAIPRTMQKPTVSALVRDLPRLFANAKFSKILLPFQQFMQPILPPIDERNTSAKSFNAFPNNLVYINGIKEEITILFSLQRPRKVTLIGSDGKEYAVMMKPKDDLRKDFRLMEFDAVVKQYLHQDADARQRRLSIRTYAVVPLNEECGLIEWVLNLNTLRKILLEFYKHQNQGMNSKELQAVKCEAFDPIEKKRNVFLTKLIPRHPPVFAEWFKQRFTTPHNWYQARSSYIRTTAVMSIVGYILGLGDRHGENILLDSTNGDIVHVDFNCLFNKGETFEHPEKVPFRLTHNMIHAMGPLGIEGLYRKCCEITMRVLQAQTPILMSVLRPFVYDPLVSWNRKGNNSDESDSDGNTERTDPQAMANVKHIEERLKGFVKIKGRTSNMPLSTEGQVNFIINEAIDTDNLASMYIGWGAYL